MNKKAATPEDCGFDLPGEIKNHIAEFFVFGLGGDNLGCMPKVLTIFI